MDEIKYQPKTWHEEVTEQKDMMSKSIISTGTPGVNVGKGGGGN